MLIKQNRIKTRNKKGILKTCRSMVVRKKQKKNQMNTNCLKCLHKIKYIKQIHLFKRNKIKSYKKSSITEKQNKEDKKKLLECFITIKQANNKITSKLSVNIALINYSITFLNL